LKISDFATVTCSACHVAKRSDEATAETRNTTFLLLRIMEMSKLIVEIK